MQVSPVIVEHRMGPGPKGMVPGLEESAYPPGQKRHGATPVMRIWGRDHKDRNVSVDVHGYFPYFYARPVDESAFRNDRRAAAFDAIKRGLEEALTRDQDVEERVRRIDAAVLTQFYGYHGGPVNFARIELWNPSDQRRAGTYLIQTGVDFLGGRLRLQPHESHVDFQMKFFIDFQIFGLKPFRLKRFLRHSNHIDVAASEIETVTSEEDSELAVELTALPSLRQLFLEEARIMRSQGASEADIRTVCAISSEWATPTDNSDVVKDVSSRILGNKDAHAFWTGQLQKLRDMELQRRNQQQQPTIVEVPPTTKILSSVDQEVDEQDCRRDEEYLGILPEEEEEEEEEEDRESPVPRPDWSVSSMNSLEVLNRLKAKSARKKLRLSISQTQTSTSSLTARIVKPVQRPPTPDAVRTWLLDHQTERTNPSWHYSNARDVPSRAKRKFKDRPNRAAQTEEDLPDFDTSRTTGRPECSLAVYRRIETRNGFRPGEYRRPSIPTTGGIVARPARGPPSPNDVRQWLRKTQKKRKRTSKYITPPDRTPPVETGSGARDKRTMRTGKGTTPVSILVLETLAATRPNLTRPQPDTDPLIAVAWRFRGSYDTDPDEDEKGLLVVQGCEIQSLRGHDVEVVESELGLLKKIGNLVKAHDPDVLLGWDTERESVAYLIDRGRVLKFDVTAALARTRPGDQISARKQEKDKKKRLVEIRGRICLCGYRVVVHDEVARSRSYELEAVAETMTGRKLPRYTPRELYLRAIDEPLLRWHAMGHVARRCATILQIMTELNTIGRAAEVAQLFGMPLSDAIFRGSQHRVEAVLLRLVRPRHGNPVVARRIDTPPYFHAESADLERSKKKRPWYTIASPTKDQVVNQPGLEMVAMTLEPQSDIYEDPVAVLDFRSLYPSMIIAYNMCFSTLICKLKPKIAFLDHHSKDPKDQALIQDHLRRQRLLQIQQQQRQAAKQKAQSAITFFAADEEEEEEDDDDGQDLDGDYYGLEDDQDDEDAEELIKPPPEAPVVALKSPPAVPSSSLTTGRLGVLGSRPDATSARALVDAEKSGNRTFIAPNGCVFAPLAQREGVLPRALREILAARVMVKAAMKRAAKRHQGTRVRILDARQLALKLLANVIYGYCSASFSGRQPCAELADAIVSSGRETLEDAIADAGGSGYRAAPVRYGDTDSLFVRRKGETVAEAIEWAKTFADDITKKHPAAVALKFEYVFYPCALVAKKRYVGIAYEKEPQGSDASRHPSEDGGHWICKGLECMRRDQSEFIGKTMEKVLRVLFKTRDVSEAKKTFLRSVDAAISGRTPFQDFVIRQQAKLGSYKREDRQPVANVAKAMNTLGGRIVYEERVAFVIIASSSGLPYYRSVQDLDTALRENSVLDVKYYVLKKLVPPLQRVLGLIGVNVNDHWLAGINWQDMTRALGAKNNIRGLITKFCESKICRACQKRKTSDVAKDLCDVCASAPARTLLLATVAVAETAATAETLRQRCLLCAADPLGSIDDPCPARRPSSAFPFADRPCDSRDCDVAYARRDVTNDHSSALDRLNVITSFFSNQNPPRRRLQLAYDESLGYEG